MSPSLAGEFFTHWATRKAQDQKYTLKKFRKMVTTTLYAKQQETQIYRTVFWTLGGWGMLWDNGIKTCVSYKKRIASPGSMQDTRGLGLVHWDDLEGWYGEGDGRGVQDGNTCTPVVDAC